jgi:hypothetical protein
MPHNMHSFIKKYKSGAVVVLGSGKLRNVEGR